jgi:glycosyltransferase involved in cell wall biosynthesis
MSRPALGLAIPLYNEEALVERVALDIRACLRAARIPSAIVLVNNGSTDKTGSIINRLAAKDEAFLCIHLEENFGYGGGILAGMRQLQTPILGWTWGDGQVDPEVLVEAYRALIQTGAPLAKARRVERQDGRQRQIVSTVYNRIMRILGSKISDANGCPKLFTRESWESIDPCSTDWFLDAEVVLRALELGLAWTEVDAVMHPRQGGHSNVNRDTVFEFLKHLKAWREGWRP